MVRARQIVQFDSGSSNFRKASNFENQNDLGRDRQGSRADGTGNRIQSTKNRPRFFFSDYCNKIDTNTSAVSATMSAILVLKLRITKWNDLALDDQG